MGEWKRGNWHLLEVTRSDPEFDDLEFEEYHLPDCPWELTYDGMVREYTCNEGWELRNNGFDEFRELEPGSYKFQVHYLVPVSMWEEGDTEVEIEPLGGTEDETTWRRM